MLKKPDFNLKRLQRFAIGLPKITSGGWLIHCVSVGEVTVASHLIKAIQRIQPNIPITITTTTPTGAKQVKNLLGDSFTHCYLPYDLTFMMKHLLRKCQPTQVLVTEVELWPNLIHQCFKQNTPLTLINGRMTDKSCRGYQKLSLLFAPMLQKIHAVCAQGQRDYDNYLKLGLDEHKLTLTQNIKYDISPSLTEPEINLVRQRYNPQNKKCLIGGSTHAPEESILLSSFITLKSDYPDLMLVLVPRHPQRFDEVYQLCQESGLNVTRASHKVEGDEDIVLVDKMGVLSELYAIADICFIGGSLAPKGGHNALEAALYAKPILMGPSIHNNVEICQNLRQAQALSKVESVQDIVESVKKLLADEHLRDQTGIAGLKVIEQNQGAITRTLGVINGTNLG